MAIKSVDANTKVKKIPPQETSMIAVGDIVQPKRGLHKMKVARVVDVTDGWISVLFDMGEGHQPLTLVYKAEELDVKGAMPKPSQDKIKALEAQVTRLEAELAKAQETAQISDMNLKLNLTQTIHPTYPQTGDIEFDWIVITNNTASNHSSLSEMGTGKIVKLLGSGWNISSIEPTSVAGGKNQPDAHYLHVTVWRKNITTPIPVQKRAMLPIPAQFAKDVSYPEALKKLINGEITTDEAEQIANAELTELFGGLKQ